MIPRTRYKMLLVLAAAISSRATSISTPEVIPPPAVAVHAGIHDLNTFGQTVLDLGPTGYAANRDALSDAAAWINQQRIVVGGQSTVEKNPNGTISASGSSATFGYVALDVGTGAPFAPDDSPFHGMVLRHMYFVGSATQPTGSRGSSDWNLTMGPLKEPASIFKFADGSYDAVERINSPVFDDFFVTASGSSSTLGQLTAVFSNFDSRLKRDETTGTVDAGPGNGGIAFYAFPGEKLVIELGTFTEGAALAFVDPTFDSQVKILAVSSSTSPTSLSEALALDKANLSSQGYDVGQLDRLGFFAPEPQAVPEPVTFSLVGMAVVFIVLGVGCRRIRGL